MSLLSQSWSLFLTACADADGASEIFIWTDYIAYSICTLTASLHIKFYYEQLLSFYVTGPITTRSRWSLAELWTLKWAMSVLETLVRIIAFHKGLRFFLFFGSFYGDVISHLLQSQGKGSLSESEDTRIWRKSTPDSWRKQSCRYFVGTQMLEERCAVLQ